MGKTRRRQAKVHKSRRGRTEPGSVEVALHLSPAQGESGGEAETRAGREAVLARTQVYRRLPMRVRSRVDAAILLRPSGCPTLSAIMERYRLKEEFGISKEALESYAEKLEGLVRPVVTSQVMAGMLGCLPASYRRQVVAGSEVMLISRVLQALSDEASSAALSVADLAKLATILKVVAGQGKREGAEGLRGEAGRPEAADTIGQDRTDIAEAVQAIYGVQMPVRRVGEEDGEEPAEGAG